MLLEKNGNIKEPWRDNCFHLFSAAQNGHADVRAILINNNGNGNVKIKNGGKPLFQAAENGHVDVCTVLLKNNVYMNKNWNMSHYLYL